MKKWFIGYLAFLISFLYLIFGFANLFRFSSIQSLLNLKQKLQSYINKRNQTFFKLYLYYIYKTISIFLYFIPNNSYNSSNCINQKIEI